jgi:hypothetical protein
MAKATTPTTRIGFVEAMRGSPFIKKWWARADGTVTATPERPSAMIILHAPYGCKRRGSLGLTQVGIDPTFCARASYYHTED